MNVKRSLCSWVAVAVLGVSTAGVWAQDAAPQQQQDGGQRRQRGGGPGGGGNFDPEQMRQRMLERVREQMAVTNDDEWKLIAERLQKVTEVRMAAGGGFGMFGGRGGGPGGPGGGGGGGGRRGGSPESEALQKALEDKASPEEVKKLLAKLRESRKANDAKLEKAQEELKAVLDVRQEAVAVMMGFLK